MSEENPFNDPWHVKQPRQGIDTYVIADKDDCTLAIVGVSPCGWRLGKDKRNAVLMSKAPKMKALLERLVDFANQNTDDLVDNANDILEEIENETKEA